MDINSRIDPIVESCRSSGYSQNPVQRLKYLQENLITGPPLEILDPTSPEKGDTNLVMVDRENILETGFEEILALKDKFTTLSPVLCWSKFVSLHSFFFTLNVLKF